MLALFFSSESSFSFSCAVSQSLFHFIQRNRMATVRLLLQVLSKSIKQVQECNKYKVILPEVPSYSNDKALISVFNFHFSAWVHFTFSAFLGFKIAG